MKVIRTKAGIKVIVGKGSTLVLLFVPFFVCSFFFNLQSRNLASPGLPYRTTWSHGHSEL